nr:hypothetical protein GCM10020093_041590 [Planobispora longispora]
MLAAAMDEVIGMSVWLFQRPYVTGRLETDYLAPVPVGSALHLRAWCTGMSGRKAYLEAEGRIGSRTVPSPCGPPRSSSRSAWSTSPSTATPRPSPTSTTSTR